MKKPSNPWDDAKKRKLIRRDTLSGEVIVLERGVNFFVEALERLGAITFFSCEGHPCGFYIAFSCDEKVARRVSAAGFFNVELGGVRGGWVLRLSSNEYHTLSETGSRMNEREKCGILRMVANAWTRAFLT